MKDDDFERSLAEALTPTSVEPPADRVAALRARAEQARAEQAEAGQVQGEQARAGRPGAPPRDQPLPPTQDRRPRLLLALAAGVALLVAAGAVGAAVTSGPEGSEQDLLARGVPEFAATLSDGGAEVVVDGSRAPEGRIVVLESDTLPMLPLGQYYELWFVGPDDTPGAPDRVSAGTFHPDYDDGTTLVVLHAAVDPTLFPSLEITREVGDGDPAPSSDVVLDGPLEPVA